MINIISRYPSGKKRVTQLLTGSVKETADFIERHEENSPRVFETVRLSLVAKRRQQGVLEK